MREQRIAMVAVVDAYDFGERAMGWYCRLRNKMKSPFKARCRFARAISALKVKEEVEVLGMAPEAECASEMFVDGPAGEWLCRWRNCSHGRKIERRRKASVIGATGLIAGTNYDPHKT